MARSAAIETEPASAQSAKAEGTAERDHLLVISGLSGAGKSQASKLFEDLGYSVVDNLPPALLDDFLALRRSEPDRYRRAALVLDIRAGDPAPAIERAREALRTRDGSTLEVVFLEASDATLVSRFSETRHRHPLQARRSGIQASIAEERRRLAPTRSLAEHVIDTSGLSIAQLKDRLFAVVPRAETEALRIDIVTFGFKYGIPLEADLVFDVRFLTNPYWEPELKPLSGLEEPVRDFVLGQPAAKRFLELVAELLALTVPAYRVEGKEQLRVALGCTGGYHRSIALAEELAERLRPLENTIVTVFHRELER